jgi:hypothetical protein
MSVDAGVLVGRRSRAEIGRLVALYRSSLKQCLVESVEFSGFVNEMVEYLIWIVSIGQGGVAGHRRPRDVAAGPEQGRGLGASLLRSESRCEQISVLSEALQKVQLASQNEDGDLGSRATMADGVEYLVVTKGLLGKGRVQSVVKNDRGRAELWCLASTTLSG